MRNRYLPVANYIRTYNDNTKVYKFSSSNIITKISRENIMQVYRLQQKLSPFTLMARWPTDATSYLDTSTLNEQTIPIQPSTDCKYAVDHLKLVRAPSEEVRKPRGSRYTFLNLTSLLRPFKFSRDFLLSFSNSRG